MEKATHLKAASSPELLDGRREAKKILTRLAQQVKRRKLQLRLATIQVGTRPDATLYLRLKAAAAKSIGIATEQHRLPASTSQAKLAALITRLNKRHAVTGILLQLPLSRHLNADLAVAAIDPQKDVDGFSPAAKVVPPPIAGVLHLLSLAKPPKNSRVVLLGKDSVFTTELAGYLQKYLVSLVNPRNQKSTLVKNADVIITATGRGPRLTAAQVKSGVIIIDVGIRHQGGQVVGDADPSVYKKAKAYSPVPGGVGPLTIAFVLKNTVKLGTAQ